VSAAESRALAGRVAVVTGTSRGIGRATAVALAKLGAHVVGCSRQADGPSFVSDLGEGQAAACAQLLCDVAQPDQVGAFAQSVLKDWGTPFVLVNNSGNVARALFEQTTDAAWDQVLSVNLSGTFFMTRAFLPAMKERAEGRIINIASIAGRQGTAQLSAYCAAKHGVVGLTRALSEELRGTALTANAICPGSVATEMLQQGVPGAKPNMSPEDIAEVVCFLAAQAPAALAGSCVDVFGGS